MTTTLIVEEAWTVPPSPWMEPFFYWMESVGADDDDEKDPDDGDGDGDDDGDDDIVEDWPAEKEGFEDFDEDDFDDDFDDDFEEEIEEDEFRESDDEFGIDGDDAGNAEEEFDPPQ